MYGLNMLDEWYFKQLLEGGYGFELTMKLVPLLVCLAVFVVAVIIVVGSQVVGRKEWVKNHSSYQLKGTAFKVQLISIIIGVLTILASIGLFFVYVVQDQSEVISDKIASYNEQETEVKTGIVEDVELRGIDGSVEMYKVDGKRIGAKNLSGGQVGDEIDYKTVTTYELNEIGNYVEVEEDRIQEIRYK